MKLTHFIYKGLTSLLIAVMGLACQSCSEEVAGGAEDVDLSPIGQLTVTVVTPDAATRTMGTFDDTAADNELIHSCVVAFVKEDDTVVKVSELPKNTTGVDKQEFSVILEAGSYRAYAFANFDQTSLGSLNLVEKTKLTLGDFEKLTIDVDADNLTSESKIPMSGYLKDIVVAENGTVKIKGTQKTEVTIPVVRMVGKLEFQFTNASTSSITITEVSVKPAATGEVKLLPTWDDFGKTLVSPNMEGVTREDSIKRNPSDLTIAENNEGKCSLYLREIVSNHPTKHFPIRIKYKKGNSTDEETMTALLYDLTQINRNDWIRVPITLTDYKLRLDVEFYPPIGGFPAVTSEEKEDEYYVTFGTAGWFGIEAFAYNKANGTVIDSKKVEIISVAYDESASTYFRKNPAVESSCELTGEINSGLTSGAASIVTIQVKVTDGTTEATFTRKIHFLYN